LRLALELEPEQSPEGGSPITRTLIERGKRALTEARPRDALRWGRKALAITESDPDSHALVAEALFSLRDFAGAADEYSLALASRPEDRNLKRNLGRARTAMHAERAVAAPARPRAKAPAALPAAVAAEPASASAASPEPAAPPPPAEHEPAPPPPSEEPAAP
jgi:Tfp pilus assembly protein PilF